MRKNKLFIIAILFLLPLKQTLAANNSYVTIVNPIRDRSLWHNLDYLKQQVAISKQSNLSTTWLVQYDVLFDKDIIKILKRLPDTHEIGLFYEVSEKLTTDSEVPYLFGKGDWAKPDKVFFSGYTPVNRKIMTDKLYHTFKDTFGHYPSSVGAWYIDSFSLSYLKDKYSLKTALVVSDQYTTDAYRLWGQPWGVPFYPSRFNPLIPTQSLGDKLDVVMLQWALRDPLYGYGTGVPASTYSLQANDYVGHHKLSTNYFQQLLLTYLNSSNDINQATVGLEVGQEAQFLPEYENQIMTIKRLSEENDIEVITLSDFAETYNKSFQYISPISVIECGDFQNINSGKKVFWFNSPYYRAGILFDENNLSIFDLRIYTNIAINPDIVSADSKDFLDRQVPAQIETLTSKGKVIFSELKSLESSKADDSFILSMTDVANNKHIVEFSLDRIRKDGQLLYPPFIYKKDYKKEILLTFLKLENYLPTFKAKAQFGLSRIDDTLYLGLVYFPDHFIGLKTKYSYVGLFNFPFQTLTRFRNFPQLDFHQIVFNLLTS